jgi:excinuclease UvrABC nuclease subunit
MEKGYRVEKEEISIPSIVLEWSPWIPWNDIKIDMRFGEGIRVPNKSGVYEAKYVYSEERLTIGKASNLRMRVKQGLVKGKVPHSAGDRIRDSEKTLTIVVRWAETDRPSAVEEKLHKRHQVKFGRLPKYVEHT